MNLQTMQIDRIETLEEKWDAMQLADHDRRLRTDALYREEQMRRDPVLTTFELTGRLPVACD